MILGLITCSNRFNPGKITSLVAGTLKQWWFSNEIEKPEPRKKEEEKEDEDKEPAEYQIYTIFGRL